MFIEDDIKTEPSSSPETCNGTNGLLNNDVKLEDEISTADATKVEFNNKHLFCNNCQEYYQDYCTKCRMLVHILNQTAHGGANDRMQEEIPVDILEIRFTSGRLGIFALKTIPEDVRFGPFTGLSSSKCCRKIKCGRFTVDENELKSLNWMRHINPARNISEQNLLVYQSFQCEDNLYYRSIREIQAGEELLVYFGKEYDHIRNRDVEMDFIARLENNMENVFACSYCCLGFSSWEYLAKHKNVCRKEIAGRFSFRELRQCPVCHILLGKMEYLEHHVPNCWKKTDSFRTPVALVPYNETVETVEVRREVTTQQRPHIYKCSQCRYQTTYKGDLVSHANQHYKVKMFGCGICKRRFKMRGYLKRHVERTHADVERKKAQNYLAKGYLKIHLRARRSKVNHISQSKGKRYECFNCQFRTKYKPNLIIHIKTKHLMEFKYKCGRCEYKTNDRQTLERHTKTKHLKVFNYKCGMCEYKTNYRPNLEIHVKSIHLKEFYYECEVCDYKTNVNAYLENHIKTNHLNEFRYDCQICDFKTDQKMNLQIHVKTRHLKEFDYKCKSCPFKTNVHARLMVHVKSMHLKEFRYKCDTCEYETNQKAHLKSHFTAKHLKEYRFACESCKFKTNHKQSLQVHHQTKHLKEYKYKCDRCDLKTNSKNNLVTHMKSVHLQEFRHVCTTCPYKTNRKSFLDLHVRTKHLKQFNYECESCGYKTNYKPTLERHIKTKHLKEFDHKCENCKYKTNCTRSFEKHIKTKHSA